MAQTFRLWPENKIHRLKSVPPGTEMLLAIDIGNTNTSLGVFDGASLLTHWRLTTERARTGDEWGVLTRNLFELSKLDCKSIDAIAIASVVPPLNFTIKRM